MLQNASIVTSTLKPTERKSRKFHHKICSSKIYSQISFFVRRFSLCACVFLYRYETKYSSPHKSSCVSTFHVVQAHSATQLVDINFDVAHSPSLSFYFACSFVSDFPFRSKRSHRSSCCHCICMCLCVHFLTPRESSSNVINFHRLTK